MKREKATKQTPLRMPPEASVNAMLALYNARRYAEAESRTRALLGQYPDFGFGWKLLGGTLQMQGKDALPAFQKVAALTPNDPEAHFNLAVAFKKQGLFDEAVISYRRAIQLKPDYAEAHNSLGNTLKDLGHLADALASYRRAIKIKPDSADTHNNMGIALQALGQLNDAIASYRQAVALKPDFALAYYNLGNAQKDAGLLDDAVTSYRSAIAIKPDFAEAFYNLGHALKNLGSLDEATSSFRRAVEIRPDFAEAHNNLGRALQELGQTEDALASFRRAVAIKPDFAEAYNNLGSAQYSLRQTEDALASFHRAVAIKPDFALAHSNLGAILKSKGDFQGAKTCFRKAQELGFESARVRGALMLPVIMGTQQEIRESRSEFERNLDQLMAKIVPLGDPLKNTLETNFYLAYHGLNDRDLQVKVAKFYEQACPSLLYASPHCTKPKSDSSKIKVGFISSFFTNHPVSDCYSKVIEKLSAMEQFEVFLFSDRPINKQVYAEFSGSSTQLPYNLDQAREIIAESALDVLIYLDIGMESFSYFLAFSRLARSQCVLGGHPVTTGINNIDYFLSSKLSEPGNGDEHYSEKLIRFNRSIACLARPALPASLKTRRQLGLPEGRRLYMCPMKLQKLHPDFDEAMARILEIDEEGVVVLFEDSKYPTWKEYLERRFEYTIPGNLRDRIVFSPWLRSQVDFISAISEAAVILDPFHFGSGSTLSIIFSTGTPLVTLPSKFMRGRIGMGNCLTMGLNECIAENLGDYVQKAVAFATAPTLREKIKQKILNNNSVFYDNPQAVEELAGFICSLETGWGSD